MRDVRGPTGTHQVFVSPLGEPRQGARTDPVALGLRRKHRLLDSLQRDGDAA